jgi:hypothetical protein
MIAIVREKLTHYTYLYGLSLTLTNTAANQQKIKNWLCLKSQISLAYKM